MRKKLIELRKKKGFTQEKISNILKISRSTYVGYELGNFYPSLKIAMQIKKILEYEKDDIFLNLNDSKTNKTD